MYFSDWSAPDMLLELFRFMYSLGKLCWHGWVRLLAGSMRWSCNEWFCNWWSCNPWPFNWTLLYVVDWFKVSLFVWSFGHFWFSSSNFWLLDQFGSWLLSHFLLFQLKFYNAFILVSLSSQCGSTLLLQGEGSRIDGFHKQKT